MENIISKKDSVMPFKIRENDYDFVDPCPQEMKQVRGGQGVRGVAPYTNILHAVVWQVPISELSEVSIDWKMLTTARPEKKMDEKLYTQ